MLATQLLGLGPSGFYGVLGDLGDTTSDIKILQQTLINAKKSDVKVSGKMDGATLAGAYEIILAKGGTVAGGIAGMLAGQGASQALKDVFSTIQGIDSTLKSIDLNIPQLLRALDSGAVQSLIAGAQAIACSGGFSYYGGYGLGDVCDVLNSINDTLNSFNSTMTNEVGTINKVMSILVPTEYKSAVASQGGGTTAGKFSRLIAMRAALSPLVMGMKPAAFEPPAPTAPPAPTTPAAPVVAAGTIYFFDKKLNKYRIAIPKVPVAATPAAPAHYGFGGLGVMDGNQCIFGDCGLNAAATYTEIAPSTTAPGAPAVSVTETDFQTRTGTLPIYKKPLFWAILGVVIIGGGGATFWLMRRRKKAAPAKAAAPAPAPAPAAAKAAW